MRNSSFILRTYPRFVAAFTADERTCVYLRMRNGLEIINATRYGDSALAATQRAVAEYFGLDATSCMFITNAPEEISPQGLALLAVATQIQGVSELSVVDGGRLEVVETQ